MPTYEYECAKCGTVFDHFQSIKAPKLTHCTEKGCRGKVIRLLGTGGGIIFKGGGFTKQITAVKTTRAAKRKPATPPRKLLRKNRTAKNLIPKRKVARKVSPKRNAPSLRQPSLAMPYGIGSAEHCGLDACATPAPRANADQPFAAVCGELIGGCHVCACTKQSKSRSGLRSTPPFRLSAVCRIHPGSMGEALWDRLSLARPDSFANHPG